LLTLTAGPSARFASITVVALNRSLKKLRPTRP
jgi:hypothetical protein